MTLPSRTPGQTARVTNILILSLILSTKLITPSLAAPLPISIPIPASISSAWSSLPASAPNFNPSNPSLESFDEESGTPPTIETMTTDEEIDSDEKTWVLELAPTPSINLHPSTSPPPSPPSPLPSPPSPTTILSSLTSLLSLPTWRTLLGPFFIFWALIASTVGLLILVALRVRRLERERSWRRMQEDGDGEIKGEGEELGDGSEGGGDDERYEEEGGRMAGLQRLRAAVLAGARNGDGDENEDWKTGAFVEVYEEEKA